MDKNVFIEIFGEAEDPLMGALRQEVRIAMKELNLLPTWTEYYPNSYNIPAYLKNISKPALGINGKLILFKSENSKIPNAEAIKHKILSLSNEYKKIKRKKKYSMLISFFLNMFIAFFPKCPFCWAAYLSLLGIAGTSLTYKPWMLPLAIALLSINLLAMYFSKNRHQFKPFWLSLLGTLLIISNRIWFDSTALIILAGIILVFASVWNALPRRMAISANHYLSSVVKTTVRW